MEFFPVRTKGGDKSRHIDTVVGELERDNIGEKKERVRESERES